ncbi:MAG TPA: hypothetical protein VJT73_08270 [Polyangiaceae bacterium]|nr:hypothetical protein [Polyangiaceae bacterium]
MLRRLSALALASTLLVPAFAHALDFPGSINEPPKGPGTEQPTQYRTASERVRPGWEAGVQAGAGIGFGFGGRVGYSFVPGIYVGGAANYFLGSSVNTPTGTDKTSQFTFGGEVGYKIYPQAAIELRPYVFAGTGTFERFQTATARVESDWKFTLYPGFLAAYHFGNAFVSAEGRLQVTPSPVAFAIMGGVGLGL